MKIDKSNSLRLSGCLIYYRINCDDINRYRLALSISKSCGMGGGGDGGGRAEMPAEFWPCVSS